MFMSLIRERRSVRSFQDKPVEPEKTALIIEAALRSPSSRGLNPWEFIVVRDKDMLAALSACKPHGATFLKNAPLGIVVLADPARCDVWVEDASIAATYIQLAAESLGLKSCWIQIRKRLFDADLSARDRVSELLGIPANLDVECIIAVGYPDEHPAGHLRESLRFDKVHDEAYGTPFE